MQMSQCSPDALALSTSTTTGTRALGRAMTDSICPDASIFSASSETMLRCASISISEVGLCSSSTRVRSRSAPRLCSPETDEPKGCSLALG